MKLFQSHTMSRLQAHQFLSLIHTIVPMKGQRIRASPLVLDVETALNLLNLEVYELGHI